MNDPDIWYPAAPLVKELRSDNTAEFKFIHGPVEVFPPKTFETYFGRGPYYRFIKPVDAKDGTSDVLDRIRNFPKGATAEDQMRALMGPTIGTPMPNLDNPIYHSSQEGIAYLYDIMERDGPFDGIIGYSEGATVAATLLLHEQRRFEVEGRVPMFKCAVFFAGWPPMNPDLNAVVLADESDLQITIPTCHVSKYSLICSAYLHYSFCWENIWNSNSLYSWIFGPVPRRLYVAL